MEKFQPGLISSRLLMYGKEGNYLNNKDTFRKPHIVFLIQIIPLFSMRRTDFYSLAKRIFSREITFTHVYNFFARKFSHFAKKFRLCKQAFTGVLPREKSVDHTPQVHQAHWLEEILMIEVKLADEHYL